MIAKNCTLQDLESAAAEVGLALLDPRDRPAALPRLKQEVRFRLQLRPGIRFHPDQYRRMGQSGRRIAAVCWHGHRDFFRALFARCPGAIIKTGLATYNGAEHFKNTFAATGDINIGSAYRPLLAREACFCEEEQS